MEKNDGMTFQLGENLTLWGRSRAADATGFVVPELNIMFDAGLIVSSAKPQCVLITHSHFDHAHRVTHLTSRQVVPSFFVPKGLEPFFERYIRTSAELSGNSQDLQWEANCKLVGVDSGDTFLLQHKREFRVRVFEMVFGTKKKRRSALFSLNDVS
jgi:glyoxylase-like metal-dependent hydrolase (beta-lactamase superfamily II)